MTYIAPQDSPNQPQGLASPPARGRGAAVGAAVFAATVLSAWVGWAATPRPPAEADGQQHAHALSPEQLQEDAPTEPPTERANDCVEHTTSVRYVMGYDHLVHLKSECSKMALCDVRTNVSQESIEATVQPGGKKTVVTFRGSPARVFEATVNCRFPGG